MKHSKMVITYTMAINAKKCNFSHDSIVGIYSTRNEARKWLKKFAKKYNNINNMPGIYNWNDNCDVVTMNDGAMFCVEYLEDFLKEQ